MPRAALPPESLYILGHPIAHSMSPVFQNAALRAIGKSFDYERVDVTPDALAGLMQELAHENAAGNVTIPHKEAVARFAHCTPLAKRVGAVNTFWHDTHQLIGHNTDVAGVTATVNALLPAGFAGRSCALLGAGGSAAAVLVSLADLGCRDIVMHARSRERAQALAERLEIDVRLAASAEQAVDGASMIINSTPLGMNDHDMPVEPTLLDAHAVVFDLVYRPEVTPWVRACRAAGHRAEDGLRMLLEQGAAAFACWFGEPVPRSAMWHAVGRAWPDHSGA